MKEKPRATHIGGYCDEYVKVQEFFGVDDLDLLVAGDVVQIEYNNGGRESYIFEKSKDGQEKSYVFIRPAGGFSELELKRKNLLPESVYGCIRLQSSFKLVPRKFIDYIHGLEWIKAPNPNAPPGPKIYEDYDYAGSVEMYEGRYQEMEKLVQIAMNKWKLKDSERKQDFKIVF